MSKSINRPMFHAYHLNLTENQMRSFARGNRIRVSAKNLHGQDLVYLTVPQIRKIENAKRSGKGVMLTLSEAQRSYHRRYGSGRFGDFFKSIGHTAKNVGLSIGQKLLPVALDAVSNRLNREVGARVSNDTASKLIKSGVNYGKDLGSRAGHDYLESLKTKRGGMIPVRTRDLLDSFGVNQKRSRGSGLYLSKDRGQGLYLAHG